MDGKVASGLVNELLPDDPTLTAHCRRVAVLAAEIAREVKLPPAGAVLLRQAALLHHLPPLLRDPAAVGRLLADVLGADREYASRISVVPSDVASVLRILHGRSHGPAAQQLSRVAAILQLSDLLDEQMQLLACEDCAPPGMWAGLEQISEFTLFDRMLLKDARRALTAGHDPVIGAGSDVAVQAGIARKVFSALAFQRDCEIRELEMLATADPVLAGRLIQVANSAIYSPLQRMGSVRQAIAYVGTGKTRKVMLAAALEPVFAGRGMHGIWKHSLRAAQLCETLAQSTGILDPDEALLLGLVHDIGRQATQRVAADRQSTFARLVRGGCPPAYVEQLFLGRDHGEVGWEVLRDWNFPEHLSAAVRYHHRPEATGSLPASIVYLVEFWTGGEEDLPSLSRLGAAMARTGVSGETLTDLAPRRGSLFELLSAA